MGRKGPPPEPVPGWGPQPGEPLRPHSIVESYFMRKTGQNRVEIIHEDYEAKPKKERKGWFIFQRGKVIEQGGPEVRQLLGEVNRDIMHRDSWYRSQVESMGGGAPGPPAGFEYIEQANPPWWQPGPL